MDGNTSALDDVLLSGVPSVTDQRDVKSDSNSDPAEGKYIGVCWRDPSLEVPVAITRS